MDKSLPPMPGSDTESFEKNKYDSFYEVKSADWWKGNAIERIPEPKLEKCNHDFIYVKNGVQCKKCNFGLLGYLEIRGGSLFYKGEPLGI